MASNELTKMHFEDYIWANEDKGDLADNFHLYSADQFFAYTGRATLDELKTAFPMAWESFKEDFHPLTK
jgi:hypothetical protein